MFKYLFVLSLVLGFCQLSQAAPLSGDVPYQYQIKFSDSDRRWVSVQAHVRLKSGALMMAPWGFPEQLPNGWASFVENLEVLREGKPVPVQLAPPGQWRVDAPDGTMLELHYNVRLRHDQHDWKSAGGVDARPAVLKDTVTWITKGLIISSDDDDAKSRVSFDLPPGWTAATPWHEIAGANNTWAPTDLYQTYDNAIVVGQVHKREIVNGPMKIVLVTDPALAAEQKDFEQALTKDLAEFKRILGVLPDTRYLIAIRKDVADDGEAFGSSFVEVFNRADMQLGRIIWGRLFAHEMFHYWNASRLKVTDTSDQEWFTEGVTEYIASRTAFRTGQMRESDWFQMLGTYMGRFYSARYMQAGEKPSLALAGKSKQKNWRLIYGGGATLGLLLDIELREATGNHKSLDDVLRLRDARFAATGKPYATTDLLNLCNEVGGRDFAPFFKAYVQGTETFPPITETLAKAGLYVNTVVDEFYITHVTRPTAAQLALRKSLFGAADRSINTDR